MSARPLGRRRQYSRGAAGRRTSTSWSREYDLELEHILRAASLTGRSPADVASRPAALGHQVRDDIGCPARYEPAGAGEAVDGLSSGRLGCGSCVRLEVLEFGDG
ncbi:hypothetical protein [Streptomyces sp. NRRL S-813]|uniref:wHTH domain-containing protein n=1 Tax=Streptomyces sp. NRRL S-813 TaxID=1463919 RepID=UPI003B63C97D